MQTEIIKNTEEFEKMEKEWSALVEKSGSDNIFLTHDWLYSWWKYFGEKVKLFIIKVKDRDSLVGIAPLCILNKYGFRVLSFIGSDLADYEDFILCGKNEQRWQVINKIFEKIKNSNEFDIFMLKKIKAGSNNFQLYKEFFNDKNGLDLDFNFNKHKEGAPYLKLDENVGFDTYLRTLKAKFWSDIKRTKRHLEKRGVVSFKLEIEDVSEIKFVLEELKIFHNSRRQNKGETSFLEKKECFSFYSEIAQRFHKKNWLQLNRLYCGGEIIAVHFGYLYNGIFHYQIPSFDQDYRLYSVSRLLLFELIKDSFNRKLKRFDFMLGEEEYKKKWKPAVESLYFLTIRSKNIKGYLAMILLVRLNLFLKKIFGRSW